jgi:hypothetical protein
MSYHDDDAYPPVRAFVFTLNTDPTLRSRLEEGIGERLRWFADCDVVGTASDGFNTFVALDCETDEEARDIARTYFHSDLALGRIRGVRGLKNI